VAEEAEAGAERQGVHAFGFASSAATGADELVAAFERSGNLGAVLDCDSWGRTVSLKSGCKTPPTFNPCLQLPRLSGTKTSGDERC